MIDSIHKLYNSKLLKAASWPRGALRLPKFQAHRGVWVSGSQENTLDAFKEAKLQKAEMFECDIQLSADFIPIIFHDAITGRFSKNNRKVAELTAQECKQEVNAPTLEEVLIDPNVPMQINIELKTNSLAGTPLERKVVQLIRKLKAENRVLFSSFNPFSLYLLKQLAPEIPRALLVSSDDHKDNKFYLKKMLLAPITGFHMLNLDYKMINEELMELCHKKKIPVAAWTVNDRSKAQLLLEWGVSSIISDQFYNFEMLK